MTNPILPAAIVLAAALLVAAAPATAQSREDAEKLKTKIYSADIDGGSPATIARLMKDAMIQVHADKTKLFSYRDAPVDEPTRKKLYIQQKQTYRNAGSDMEINVFVDPIPNQPNRSRANIYFVVIQNPDSGGGRRAAPENIGGDWDNNVKIMASLAGRLFPWLQQRVANAPTPPRQAADGKALLVTIPTDPVAALPKRSPEIAELERLFAAKDFAGLHRYAQPLAEAGDPVAQRAMAYLLFTGQGVAPDHSLAERWLQKAIDNGDKVAPALALLNGWARRRDSVAGITMLKEAAARGDTHALYTLAGLALEGGSWGAADPVVAAQLFAAAGKLGMPIAEAEYEKIREASPVAQQAATRYTASWRIGE